MDRDDVLPVVCLQGENNMRKAHFGIPSFGNKSKQLDHTGSTSCPKPDFNYHFSQQLHTALMQAKHLFLLVNILTYFGRGKGECFQFVYFCCRLCQVCIQLGVSVFSETH